MRILFISDNFPPEGNAPANRTFEHCREWVNSGAEVTVITCQPNFPEGRLHPGYRNRLYTTEMIEGIKVIRVWTFITPNRGTIRRSLDYLSFCISAFLASLFHKTDVIIATSPQLFAALAGFLSSFFKRVPWVMEVRDLWPESIRAVNASNNKRILRNLAKLVVKLYKSADRIVVVTDAFKSRIAALGIAETKIKVVKNGVLTARYSPAPPRDELLHKLQLQSKFVVGYIGTHGMAHGLDLVLEAAAAVNDPTIHFLMIGEGAMKNRLEVRKKALGLSNVTMLPPVHRDEVVNYIRLIDVAVVPLRNKKTFRTVLPSKIFENAACGKPILLGVAGEAKELIESFGAGLPFIPENVTDFIQKLNRMKRDVALYEKLKLGSLALARSFDRRKFATQLLYIFMGVQKRRAASLKRQLEISGMPITSSDN